MKKLSPSKSNTEYGKFLGGKYRGILISVALFILLDASVMILNFYVSFEISADAVGINLAGRQRMLSQRMAKTLYVLNSESADSKEFSAAIAELKSSEALFDETLRAFTSGGEAHNANKELIILPQVKSDESQKTLKEATDIWLPYKAAIDQLLDDVQSHRDYVGSLASALEQAKLKNIVLLGHMNDLTVDLEAVASSKATRLRIIQTIGISLAILNFLFIMLHFLRQLRDSDAVLELARKETTEILQTVNEGLFLVDENLIIGNQYSKQLLDILGIQDIAGQNFQSLLENIISEKDAETARGFIELLFDKKVKAKLIGDLNPLNLIEVNIAQASGGFLTKYLQFSFARAQQEGEISHVLVTVLDVTEKVRLEKALAESRKHSESQIELLTSLLHTHPSLLQEFINNSYECYNRINNVLRQPAKTTQMLKEKIVSIFREIHNFKGEAASLKLEYFESRAHAIEDSLQELRGKSDITGNDFLPLAVQLENIISYTQQVQQLTEKLALFGHYGNKGNTSASEKNVLGNRQQDGWGHLGDFVKSIAQRNGKLVKFVASGLHEIDLEPKYAQQVKEICIQLLRNAVTHGIESPEDRELTEKPLEGRIDLRMAKISDTEMEISVMDDGKGLDYGAIREKALESGRWSEDEIESWGNKHLLALIFHEGFSTAKEISKDAGRGVGMEAVMNHVLQHRGKITVSSRRGRHCRFVITLPIVAVQEGLAA
ncbi:ATP-binding protein [Cellvibrio sp.]|uniref:ATP-binding protein n=1 Tax=Cellvibrio sp. TaxID=1965322 RepID=UPI00396487A4